MALPGGKYQNYQHLSDDGRQLSVRIDMYMLKSCDEMNGLRAFWRVIFNLPFCQT